VVDERWCTLVDAEGVVPLVFGWIGWVNTCELFVVVDVACELIFVSVWGG
jgi:hypothetical protein